VNPASELRLERLQRRNGDLLELHLAERRQQVDGNDRAIVLDRRGLPAAVLADVAHILGARVGERRPVRTIPGSVPRRASSSVRRSQSSASRLVK
jgi:hypothetical protein